MVFGRQVAGENWRGTRRFLLGKKHISRESISPDWLKLSALSGLSALNKNRLLEPFGSADQLFAASDQQLLDTFAGNRRTVACVQKARQVEIGFICDWLALPGNGALSLQHRDYPAQLKVMPDAPVVLYFQGRSELLSRPQLAVVGSRLATPLGRKITTELAAALCGYGLGITSGLALGIDRAAHQAAMEHHGWTVAVAATGLDRVYPTCHTKLAQAIRQQGVLVSEYPPATPVTRWRFPQRNRLISGLSLGVLIVEAASRSGSLITARLAAEQGREVFAVPGSIKSPLSRGCHALLRQGAKLVETITDIVEELPVAVLTVPQSGQTEPSMTASDLSTAVIDPILALVGQEILTLDEIVVRSGLTAATVSAMLLRLEVEGRVASTVDGRFQQLS